MREVLLDLRAVGEALEADEPEAVVDQLSRTIKAGLSDGRQSLYPEIERQFAAMVS